MLYSRRLILGVLACSLVVIAGRASPLAEPQAAVAPIKADELRPFTGDPHVARQGRALFLKFNCYSCHGGLAGGGMGPSLRDTSWKYNGTDEAIYKSIHDGRPFGMPTWGNTLTPDQIRTLVIYIKSLRTTGEPTFFWDEKTESAR